jgi:phosphatidylserine/phosphatidylglycerophosphate/cardiolipin synthase-like enzyme
MGNANVDEQAIETMFLRQQGADPFTEVPERVAQATAVASRIANFIAGARSTLDIAIYDFRLHGGPASAIVDAVSDRVKAGITVRIAYDAATNSDPSPSPAEAPALLEADKKPPGTESFIGSFRDLAAVKAITGYRVLMHDKYIVRDAASPQAAIFTGSANFTNDSWGLQENNLMFIRSQALASCYVRDFAELWSQGKVRELPGNGEVANIQVGGIPIAVGFTPGESPAILKEIVGAISAVRSRLLVASVVISSGPILAALSEAIDRGITLAGIYDGPQMDQVERQWKAAHVGADKVNTWQKVARRLARKNSIPYNRDKPHQPHNFMHNKLVVADDCVVTGSFNLSNHAMGNAENVLLIKNAEIARKYDVYLRELIAIYTIG